MISEVSALIPKDTSFFKTFSLVFEELFVYIRTIE